jgi:hypothetical protein
MSSSLSLPSAKISNVSFTLSAACPNWVASLILPLGNFNHPASTSTAVVPINHRGKPHLAADGKRIDYLPDWQSFIQGRQGPGKESISSQLISQLFPAPNNPAYFKES